MRLFRRINAILTANFNELIDRFEQPSTMLRQAVREMEDTIQSALESAAEVVASEKLLARQISHQETEIEAAFNQAESAVARGDEALARSALARRKEYETLCDVLKEQWNETRETSERLKRQVAAMQIRLAEARRKLKTLTARQSAAEARSKLATCFVQPMPKGEAFSLFERMASKVETAEAKADALSELNGLQLETDNEFAADEIEAELNALRSSLATD